ncbi:MAG: GGDEF domain-containing protein [Candidatus Mcinerneyibacterium aminivorans]|uniref:GGDEF domain-containing protein n=1 Tax=Candidatus Mcinerneyibacterium aminivorans TaxID=2703815 RepID=A0A5D0MEJ1_9BACT|nr:MAG: GGDEF domain-containing protein [Candidatus Mcinerneyibacterium aminivorans]
MHYHGQKKKAYEAFKQALIYAKKSSDFSILPTAYNNMAITFSDPLKAREYYKTAFDYAYKLEDYSTAYVLIHNLSELMGNEKFLGIVEKNKNFLFEKEIARGSLRTFLYFYYSLIISCHQKNELKKFNGFYKFLKSIDCEKSNSFYNSYSYFIILSKIILEGYKDYFDEIQNLLKKVSNYHFDLVVDSIIKWIFVYLDKSKKIKILDEIIKNGKEKLEKQHFSTYKILKKILKKEKIDYNQLLRKIENKPEYDTAYFHILLHYSKILKTNKKEEYQKYLSFVCKKIKAIKNRYKSENLFKKTYYKMLFDKIKKSFPEEYHKIFEENENLIIRDIDYEKYINDMYFNDKRNTKKYMDVFLKNCLKITNFDRAIFYEKKDDDFVELKRYIQNPFLYGDYDLCDFRKYLEDIENNILIRDINKKFVDIEKILIIPIIDFDKYKRYKYTKENKNKSILSTSEKDYLLGILYLDRINGAKIGTPKYILKFIQIFFNEYWNRYVSYEKYIKDDLTGLLLKNVFLKKVSESIYESTGQNKRHLSFLLLDIDNFKEINDKYGHQKGDEILKKLAWIIKKATRDTDLVGRYGGEEFIIALNETPKSSAYEVAERIRQTIQKKQLMGNLRELTVSIGISSYPQDSKWIEEIINKADDALYEAKDKGKNRVEVFLK